MNPTPDLPSREAADRAPLSPGRRAWLLTILVLVPFTMVCLPAALVFEFSGRQGTFASWGKHRGEPDVSGLRSSLERTAGAGLPAPDPLQAGAVQLHASPERAAARVEKVLNVARGMGGSAAEGLPAENQRIVWAEIPASRAQAFRDQLENGAASSSLPTIDPKLGKENVEVVIRIGDE